LRALAPDPLLKGAALEFARLGWLKAHFSELSSAIAYPQIQSASLEP
jgi:hypothetical protein